MDSSPLIEVFVVSAQNDRVYDFLFLLLFCLDGRM